MFKNLLAGLGIGAAKVNLEITRSRAALGEVIEGEVRISGGKVDQQVEQVGITLMLESKYKHDDKYVNVRHEIGTIKVADKMAIKAGSPEKVIPVRLQLPYDIPVSRGRTRYYFVTNLDVKNAADPNDADEIVVLPNTYMQMVFDALSRLGFRDKPGSGDYNGRFQQFEYKPTGFMARELDEIELYFVAGEKELYLVMELDKKARGFFGMIADELELDERRVSYTIPYSDMQNVEQVTATLRGIIESEYRKINC